MQERISVIVPIYNVEYSLEGCINSIINQTYKNIEIILINDGSVDNSKQICEEYREKDDRILYIEQENKGVSAARNVGIENATGKFIIFVDADDYMELNMIEELYLKIKQYSCDIVVSNYLIVENDEITKNKFSLNSNMLNSEEFVKYMLSDKYYKGYLWNKLIKKSLIENTRFDEKIHIMEDLVFLLNISNKAEKVYVINDAYLYYYVQNNFSALHKISSKNLSDLFAYEKILEYIEKNKIELLDDDYNFYIWNYVYSFIVNYYYWYKNKDLKSEHNLKKKNEVKKVLIKALKRKTSVIKKIKLIFIYYFPIIYGNLKYLKSYRDVIKMKKIGILTINDDTNYGNRLQNYAVQEVLKKLDCKVETIHNQENVVREKAIKRKIGIAIKGILKLKKHKRYNCFMSFNKNIKYSKYYIDDKHIPTNLSDKYDIFFTGSDQVWNPTFARKITDIDFLCFADTQKRNSISASFGISEIPKDLKEYYKKRLNGLNNISVREDRGKEIIEELTGRNDVEVLVDPTMLLTEEEWDKVAKKPKQLKCDKYILNYFLGEVSEERKKEIDRIAKENDCEVIDILDKQSPFYQTGPSEFLYLEKNAFLICTDSFHSSIFAILYNRPFVVFDREDKEVKMNSRIETLINKFNLKNRIFKGKITRENLEHDYAEAYRILEKEREKSSRFLKRCLQDK